MYRADKAIVLLFLIGLTLSFTDNPPSVQDQTRIVYIAGSGDGKRYHEETCRTLKKSIKVQIAVAEAKRRGYTPCGICKPGD